MRKTPLIAILALLFLASPAFAQRVSGNLTAHAAACASPPAASTGYVFVPVNTQNGGATITAGGTWMGTLSFFGSGDGATTWVALNGTPSNSSTAASTTTGNGTWQVNTAGYTHVCVAFTTATSGTAVVTIQLSQASARSGGGGGGSGAVSGQANGVIPLATASTTIGAQSALSDNGTTVTSTEPIVVSGGSPGITTPSLAISSKCAAVGTSGAVACGSSAGGSFSCDTSTSAGTCVIDTSAIGAASAIWVQPDASLGTLLSVTCNTTADTGLTAPRISARSAGTSFTINMGTFTTHPLCFSFGMN